MRGYAALANLSLRVYPTRGILTNNAFDAWLFQAPAWDQRISRDSLALLYGANDVADSYTTVATATGDNTTSTDPIVMPAGDKSIDSITADTLVVVRTSRPLLQQKRQW